MNVDKEYIARLLSNKGGKAKSFYVQADTKRDLIEEAKKEANRLGLTPLNSETQLSIFIKTLYNGYIGKGVCYTHVTEIQ